MQSPRVSILMATWNRSGLISKTIESVQAQTFSDWELIIADDGSTDETPEVVREIIEKFEKEPARHGSPGVSGGPRIVYVRSEVNNGISKNYNMGLAVAKGEYVAMIDDDDPWCDDRKLEKEIQFLDTHPDYVGVGGGVIVIDPTQKELYRYLKPEKDEQIRARMLFGNPMANSTTMFRMSAAKKVGLYDSSIRYSGDRDFWLKMGLVGKLYNFPEYFSYYTMTGMNTSVAKIRPHLKVSLVVMKRYKGKYPHYFAALLLNEVQYAYAWLPEFIRIPIHYTLAKLKRRVVG